MFARKSKEINESNPAFFLNGLICGSSGLVTLVQTIDIATPAIGVVCTMEC